jgi:cell division protein FtsW
MLVFIGKYPLKYIGLLSVLEFYFLLFLFLLPLSRFSLLAGNNLGKQNQKFHTDKPDEDDYQIEKAKVFASGKIYGLGPGKVFRRTFAAILF